MNFFQRFSMVVLQTVSAVKSVGYDKPSHRPSATYLVTPSPCSCDFLFWQVGRHGNDYPRFGWVVYSGHSAAVYFERCCWRCKIVFSSLSISSLILEMFDILLSLSDCLQMWKWRVWLQHHAFMCTLFWIRLWIDIATVCIFSFDILFVTILTFTSAEGIGIGVCCWVY